MGASAVSVGVFFGLNKPKGVETGSRHGLRGPSSTSRNERENFTFSSAAMPFVEVELGSSTHTYQGLFLLQSDEVCSGALIPLTDTLHTPPEDKKRCDWSKHVETESSCEHSGDISTMN